MKKLIFSFLVVLLLTSCIDRDRYHSKIDAETLMQHSKTVKGSETSPALKLDQGQVIRIRKVSSGVYYVMIEFFTDEAGYFVLTNDTLPEITGNFVTIKENVFSYDVRG